jgi:response regulator RpfG family c-di-GMP phosphodiesterase
MGKRPTRILVVDDEPRICQFLDTLLQRDGHDVVTCLNGQDALGRLQSETYSLVLTDLKMPGMDGFELVRNIKAIDNEIPVIIITGYATIETAVQALRHGVEDYVTKPFQIEELQRVISRTLMNSQLAFDNRALTDRLQKLEAELQLNRNLLNNRARLADNDLREENNNLRNRVRELAAIDELEMATGSMLEMDEIARTFVQSVIKRVGAMRASVQLKDRDQLVVKACDDERRRSLLGQKQNIDAGISGKIVRDERAILVTDMTGNNDFSPLARGNYSTESFISVPIRYRHSFYGVLNASDRQNGESFTSSDLELMCGIGEHLGAALTRAEKSATMRNNSFTVMANVVSNMEAKDEYLRGHSERVAFYARSLAAQMGLSDAEQADVERAARLHDVGQLSIPDQIMHKNERLSQTELAQVRNHPMVSYKMIEPIESRAAADAVRHHHERFDGGGYPDKLKSDEIPLLARIISIADAYDAMTHARPYRAALDKKRACAELRAQSGKQFDAELTPVFCDSVAGTGEEKDFRIVNYIF